MANLNDVAAGRRWQVVRSGYGDWYVIEHTSLPRKARNAAGEVLMWPFDPDSQDSIESAASAALDYCAKLNAEARNA